jgi:hypothetical protein
VLVRAADISFLDVDLAQKLCEDRADDFRWKHRCPLHAGTCLHIVDVRSWNSTVTLLLEGDSAAQRGSFCAKVTLLFDTGNVDEQLHGNLTADVAEISAVAG